MYYIKKKIERYIDMTDYPISPTIPRYVGNVENHKEATLITSKPNIQTVIPSVNTGITSQQPTRQRKTRVKNGAAH